MNWYRNNLSFVRQVKIRVDPTDIEKKGQTQFDKFGFEFKQKPGSGPSKPNNIKNSKQSTLPVTGD